LLAGAAGSAQGPHNSELSAVRQIPNVLSAARIPASLALLAIYDPHSATRVSGALALALFVMATDVLDGRLARKYQLETKLGYLLDGLGDRAFHVTAYLLLLLHGTLNVLLAWVLIFREISQYAVRLVEADWQSSNSMIDRAVTQTYTATVQIIIFLELTRALLAPHAKPEGYVLLVNLLLGAIGIASYSRIIPRPLHAWREAITG
jgi:phosphatidylglycerophosphate synthase